MTHFEDVADREGLRFAHSLSLSCMFGVPPARICVHAAQYNLKISVASIHTDFLIAHRSRHGRIYHHHDHKQQDCTTNIQRVGGL